MDVHSWHKHMMNLIPQHRLPVLKASSRSANGVAENENITTSLLGKLFLIRPAQVRYL